MPDELNDEEAAELTRWWPEVSRAHLTVELTIGEAAAAAGLLARFMSQPSFKEFPVPDRLMFFGAANKLTEAVGEAGRREIDRLQGR